MTATTTRPAGSTPAGSTPAPTVSDGPVVTATRRPICTCGRPARSLLTDCGRTACRRYDLDHDRALTRAADI